MPLNYRNSYEPDQAGDLRKIMVEKDRNRTPPKLHTLSVLSGKGGVGKSNISAALSFALADFGKRVVLIDADLGMANLDILCGVRSAKWNISHLIDGARSLPEVLVHFRVSGRAEREGGSVALLPGGAGLKEIADMDENELGHLFASLSGLDETADYVIMDAGAGIHKGALSFAYASEATLLITTPEPTSIRDAYGVIKSLGAAAWGGAGGGAGLMLVVNMVTSSKEAADVAERIRLASMQFLGNAPMYLGYVLKDDTIIRSVRNCRIFYRTAPDSNAGICVRNLAGEILRICEGANIEREELPENSAGMGGFLRRLANSIFAEEKK
ncbi:MAG: P-loop NTPase [Synergistaceae bacterium]|nr:P-loop NTPase [Synergistaceae bacterium]